MLTISLKQEYLKENKLSYDEAIKLGKDFLDYIFSSLSASILSKSINKDNTILGHVLQNFLLQNFMVIP